MRQLFLALLLAMPVPAFASQCDHWSASMEEDEGGSVMTARTCSPSGSAEYELFIHCGDPGDLSIRFIPVAPAGYPPEEPNFKTNLDFAFPAEKFTFEAQYEEMDGALATTVKTASPFLKALQSEATMSLGDADGKLQKATFSLKGSKAAVQKVISTCGKP